MVTLLCVVTAGAGKLNVPVITLGDTESLIVTTGEGILKVLV